LYILRTIKRKKEYLWTSFITLFKFSYLCLNIPYGVRIRKCTKKDNFWLTMISGCLLNFQVQTYTTFLTCTSAILLHIYILCKMPAFLYIETLASCTKFWSIKKKKINLCWTFNALIFVLTMTFQSTHKKQKDSPEKNNSKLLYITCS